MKRTVHHRSQINSEYEVEVPAVDAFLSEIASVCEKHGLSISHEDGHGGFIIEPFHAHNIDWLNNASFDPEA